MKCIVLMLFSFIFVLANGKPIVSLQKMLDIQQNGNIIYTKQNTLYKKIVFLEKEILKNIYYEIFLVQQRQNIILNQKNIETEKAIE